jgi:hypothetical protein
MVDTGRELARGSAGWPMVGIGAAYGAGLGIAFGSAIGGGVGIAVGVSVGAAIGVVVGAVVHLFRERPHTNGG